MKTKEIPLIEFDPVKLTEDQTKKLFGLLLNKDKEKDIEALDDELSRSFFCQILIKRVHGYNLPFRFTNFFILASMLTFVNNPGKVMFLLRICYQYWKKTGCFDFNLDTWSRDIFPFGVPSEEYYNFWWDNQKYPGAPLGNLVDIASFWS